MILKRSYSYLREHRWKVVYGVILSLLNTTFGILSSYSLKILIDDVLMKNNAEWLWPLEFVFMGVVFFGAIFMILSAKVFNTVAAKCMLKIKEKTFKHYLKMNYEDATTIDKSEVTNVLTYSIDSLGDVLSSGIPMMISSIISIVLIVGVMIYIDYRLTIISMFVYPLLIFVNNMLQKIISKEQDVYYDRRQDVLKAIDDTVKCRDEVWSYNLLESVSDEFMKKARALEKSRVRLMVIGEFRSQASWVLIMVPYQAILYGIGGMWMIKTGNPTLGTLMVFSNFTNFLINPIMRLVNISTDISQAGVSFEKLDAFTDRKEQKSNFDYASDSLASARNLSFKYKNTDRNILSDLNFDIGLGKTTVLWGESGSGKTTFINLLTGLYRPTSGEIFVNGKTPTLENTSKEAGVVSQDFFLFSFMLGENVASSRDVDMKNAKLALATSGFGDKYPLEIYLYKDIDEDGVDVSGGEAQKIALARAIYGDKKLLLFDEPTSKLDPKSEMKVFESFNEVSKGKTSIFVSHRMSACKFADRIILFEKGKISAIGTHEEMIRGSERYRAMWIAQAKYFHSC